jgi:hypothetical protein
LPWRAGDLLLQLLPLLLPAGSSLSCLYFLSGSIPEFWYDEPSFLYPVFVGSFNRSLLVVVSVTTKRRLRVIFVCAEFFSRS